MGEGLKRARAAAKATARPKEKRSVTKPSAPQNISGDRSPQNSVSKEAKVYVGATLGEQLTPDDLRVRQRPDRGQPERICRTCRRDRDRTLKRAQYVHKRQKVATA